MSFTSKPMTATVRALLALLLAITTFGALSPSAGAGPFDPDPPIFEIDTLEELQIPTPLELMPFTPIFPGSSAEPNCETNTIDVSLVNNTSELWWIDIYADDQLIGDGLLFPIPDGPPILEDSELIVVEENQSVHILIGAFDSPGADMHTLLDQNITLDCLLPSPSYGVLSDCESGQAHARLINHGDDTASIGVQYPGAMHVEIKIAPHSSEDWLLAVSPGESIDFDVTSNDIAIGTEHLDFICEAAEEPAAAPAEEPAAAPAEQPAAAPAEQPAESDDAAVEGVGIAPLPSPWESDDAAVEGVGIAPLPSPWESDDAAAEPLGGDRTVDRTSRTIADGEDELASGSDIFVGADSSRNGIALGVVLIAIGLATLAAIAFFSIRWRAEY
jgi:hypothetical protein